MFGFSKKTSQDDSLEWITGTDEVDALLDDSDSQAVLLLKHSTRCPVSDWAMNAFVEAAQAHADKARFVALDLIQYRDISNHIATVTKVVHQSPQLFYFSGGKVLEVVTHQDVTVDTINSWLESDA